MFKWIKRKIEKIAFAEVEKRKQELFNEWRRELLKQAEIAGKTGAIDFIKENTDVAIDFNPMGDDYSWAIFCFDAGSKQYVRYAKFRHQTLEKIMRYISEMTKGDRRFIFDGPPGWLPIARDSWEMLKIKK